MEIKSENIELRNKILEGINRAFRKLVIASAERNESLVIADENGKVLHVPARELLAKISTEDK